jgi:hypothetical protein
MSDLNITVPVTTPQPVVIRGDWQSNYSFLDDPKSKTVKVNIYPRAQVIGKAAIPDFAGVPKDATHLGIAARPAVPAVEAVVPTQAIQFILWSGATYDAMQAMNNGESYGTSDLNAAIADFLTKQKAS